MSEQWLQAWLFSNGLQVLPEKESSSIRKNHGHNLKPHFSSKLKTARAKKDLMPTYEGLQSSEPPHSSSPQQVRVHAHAYTYICFSELWHLKDFTLESFVAWVGYLEHINTIILLIK